MATIEAEMKRFFFDRMRVIAAVDRTKLRALARTGAYTRQDLRRNILRRRSYASRPGQAPTVWSRDPNATLRKVFYVFDRHTNSVIVGPVRLNGSQAYMLGLERLSAPLPNILEYGGQILRTEYTYDGNTWHRASRRPRRHALTTRRRTIIIKPRPFVSVARRRNAHWLVEFLRSPELNAHRVRRAA